MTHEKIHGSDIHGGLYFQCNYEEGDAVFKQGGNSTEKDFGQVVEKSQPRMIKLMKFIVCFFV